MTLREQFIEEGFNRGKLEGELEVAKRLLEKGLEFNFIAKITNISLEKLTELEMELQP